MAFGYDEKQLEKAKAETKGRGRRVIIGLVVLALLVAAGLLAANRLLATPASMERIVVGLADDTPVEVAVTAVQMHRDGGLFSPSTWRAEFTGLEVKSKVATGPSVRAETVIVPVTDLTRAWTAGTHSFGEVTVEGLRIDLPTQPEMGDWEMDKTQPEWSVDKLVIGSAEVYVAADGVRLSASATGITGTLEDLEYDTGTRILSGNGKLDAKSLQIGTLSMTDPHAERVVAKTSTIGFEGTVGLFDTTIPIRGQLQRFHQAGDVAIILDVAGLPAEKFVESITGDPGLLRAQVDGRITVKAMGELKRGGAEIALEGAFNDSRVHFDDEELTNTLLKLVPTSRQDEESGEVKLGDLKGSFDYGPKGLKIRQLFREGPPQTRLRGTLGPDLHLVARSVSAYEVYLRPGKGAIVEHDEEGALVVRQGTDEELVLPPPGIQAALDAEEAKKAAEEAAAAEEGAEEGEPAPEEGEAAPEEGEPAPEE
jgi:hypothetical protein